MRAFDSVDPAAFTVFGKRGFVLLKSIRRYRAGIWRSVLAGSVVALAASHQIGVGQAPSQSNSVTAAAPTSLSKEESEGIIFERQQLMLQLDKDAKTLGMIAAGSAPADKLGVTTRAIAQAARDSVEAFKPIVPGGRSKPEVWSDNANFMKDMEAFAANAEKMAQAGESGNLSAVTNLMIDAMPCKQCHDRYRAPKTS